MHRHQPTNIINCSSPVTIILCSKRYVQDMQNITVQSTNFFLENLSTASASQKVPVNIFSFNLLDFVSACKFFDKILEWKRPK